MPVEVLAGAVVSHGGPRVSVPTKGTYLCSDCRRWHLTSKEGIQTEPWAKARAPR